MYEYPFNRRANGNALVEFALLLSVLLPVGFGMAMLGKLIDMKQSIEQASRYSAWEATVYSRTALMGQQASRLENRFFQAPDAPFGHSAQNNAMAGPAHSVAQHPLWGSTDESASALRDLGRVSRQKNSTINAGYEFDTGKTSAALLTGNIVANAGRPLARFSGNSWGIVADGMLRSSVNVPVQSTAFLRGSDAGCGQPGSPAGDTSTGNSTGSSICVRSAGVILADGWGASSDAQAVSRVRSLVPGSTLRSIGEGVGTLLGSVIFPELDPLDKAFGHVDMKVLPEFAKP